MHRIKELLRKAAFSDKFWFAVIFCITFAAFSPSLGFKSMLSDDKFYFLNVLSVKNSFLRIFDPVLGLSTPLTSLSFYGDFLIWGKEHFIFGAHLTNIVLHSCTAGIFYLLLRSLKWGSRHLPPACAGIAALIFALHPQRVESVAWLCERKDCLAMVTGLGALYFFLRDLRKEKISWLAGIFLVLSFLAKPMWLFFFVPAAALIWLERREFNWKFYCRFLCIPAGIFLLYMLWFLPGFFASNSPEPGTAVPLTFKIETILFNYGSYFMRTFIPGNLFPLYPYYDPAADPRWMALIPIALLCTPLLARRREFRPAVLYGVLPVLVCFAVLLIPVVGFHRVGNTDFADRYSYLPSLFLIAGAVFLLRFNIPRKSAFGAWLPLLGILYCGGLLWQTEKYLPVWRTPEAMTERNLKLAVPHFQVVFNAAYFHFLNKEYEKGWELCRKKMPVLPHYTEKFKQTINLFKLTYAGLTLFRQRKEAEGIRFLNTVYLSPYEWTVHYFPPDFAQTLFTTGAEYHLKKYNNRKGAANLYLRCSIFFKHHSPLYEAFYAGMAALTEGSYEEAAGHFARAHAINPQDERCLKNLRYAESMTRVRYVDATVKEQKK